MAKVWMLAVLLVCSAAWVAAQDQSPQTGSRQTDPTSSPSSSGQTSVEGCLQGSSGNYTLTDDSGMTYQIQGDNSKLAEHVGHEVKITGTVSGASNAAGSSASTSAGASSGGGQTLTVDKVQHKSKTCKSSASK